jgi:hypothetical protein
MNFIPFIINRGNPDVQDIDVSLINDFHDIDGKFNRKDDG